MIGAALGLGAGLAALSQAPRRWFPPTLPAELVRGCQPGELPARVPADVRRAARWMVRYLRFLESVAGGALEVRGWWRPPGCNDRRGGEPRSRHLGAWAVDVDPTPEQARRLREAIGRPDWADRVRRAIGWDGFVGARVYESGAVHVDLGCHGSDLCDPRSRDWRELL